MKQIFVIRKGQEYLGLQEKRVGFFSLHSQHVFRFEDYVSAESHLNSLSFPNHCKGDLFQIVKYYVYGG